MFTLINNYRYGSVFDRVFNDVEDKYFPRNYEETNDGFEYEFNLAGFKKENIKATVDDGMLTIEARQGDKEFYRVYSVSDKADGNSTLAKYEDGILYIKINKKESSKSVELDIN